MQAELSEEQRLQAQIINAMGQFTSNLPDYAKSDVVMLLARQINSQQLQHHTTINNHHHGGHMIGAAITSAATAALNNDSSSTTHREQLQFQLRTRYFDCLHEICSKYKPAQCFSAFNIGSQFLEDILRLTLVSDWSLRRKAHETLQQLMDKHQLLAKIRRLKPGLFVSSSPSASNLPAASSGIVTVNNKSSSSLSEHVNKSGSSVSLNHNGESATPASAKKSLATRNQTYLSQLDLSELTKFSSGQSMLREDTQFMRKYGRIFLAHLNETLFLANNRRENFETIYLTASLFLVGIYAEAEFLVDLIRFCFHVQELALLNAEQAQFTTQLQCGVHKFVCALFLLLAKSSGLAELHNYCSDVCDWRRKRHLFRFVYPEYILLEAAMPSATAPTATMTPEAVAAEAEFKRELTTSAREYSNTIKKLQTLDENEDRDNSNDNDNEPSSTVSKNLSASQRSLAAADASITKTAPWLFSKQVVGDILKNAGVSTTSLFQQSSDYSLSVSYLQQTMLSIQTVLKFRSPYSNSYESLVALSQLDLNGGAAAAAGSAAAGQTNANSNSNVNVKSSASSHQNYAGGMNSQTQMDHMGSGFNQHKRAYR
jgi:hypothetical protein